MAESFTLVAYNTDGSTAQTRSRFDGTLAEAKAFVDVTCVEGDGWSGWEERHGTWGRSGRYYSWLVEPR